MRRRGEDRATVTFQYLEPVIEIGGMVAARLGRQFQIGTEERRAKFGDKLFHRVTFIAPALASQAAVKAGRVFRPVAGFVPKD